MKMPSTILGLPIIESRFVPDGVMLIVDQRALDILKRSAWDRMADAIFNPPPPSELDIIWRDCRRFIARSCPLIAPPEWAGLEDLAPERSRVSISAELRRVILEPPKLLWWGAV